MEMAEKLPNHLRDLLQSRVEKDVREETRIEKAMQQLQREVATQKDDIDEITKERDALTERMVGIQEQVKNMTMKAKNMKAAEFEDTFEAVMREEFDAMRAAYEEKLRGMKEKVMKMKGSADKQIKQAEQNTRSKFLEMKTLIMRKDAEIRVLSSGE